VKVGQISRCVLILAALGMLVASLSLAQSFVGGVRGSVQDPGGAVIGDAKVT